MKTSRRHAAIFASILGLLAAAPAAHAQPTSTNSISLQARVAGVQSGAVDLVVKFFDAATGGTQVGASIPLAGVPVVDGVVSVPVSPIDATVFNGQTRYMEIVVDGQAMSPRTLVTSVPLAFCLVNASNPSSVNAIGNVRAEGGIHANGFAVGDWGFRADAVRGVVPNWAGSPANLLTLLGSDGLTGGYALVRRPGVVSPVVFFNDEPGNAFEIRGTEPGKNMATQSRTFFGVTRASDGSGQVQCGSSQVSSTLTVFGETSTKVLTITGGSDVAEPVAVSSAPDAARAVPGMVMVIDRDHDGKIVPCSGEYDRAVAGVISGANGLKPGMVLSAEGQDHVSGGDDTMPLAMTGRVWVLCDATGSPIRRGDALTTSRTPGHAMVASDTERRGGAVIGKAMTELNQGTGLVLVLVNLQ